MTNDHQASVPTDRLLRKIDVHLFDVLIFLDAPLAQLAADAALFVPAPGRFDIRGLHVIDPDDAGAQILHHAHRAEDVARPHRRREAVVRVVGNPQRIFLRIERDDAGDRPEDLFARDAAVVVDVVEDRRLDEEALVEHAGPWNRSRAAAAEGDLGLLLPDFLILAHAIELLAADERAHLRVPIHRRPDRNRARFLDHRVDKLLVNRPLDENAAT